MLPNLYRKIEQLERIKETPNYDEKILTIKQSNFFKVPQITAIDSFNTHNIKHMKSSKICLGTIYGNIIIYDIENNRVVLDKNFTQGKRIEVLSSSTVRYFDTYLSRIASVSRGDPNITIFSFNHSFSVINQECVISLYTPLTLSQPDIPLSCLIQEMKFSSDTFYLSASDYSGGIRLYRFNDIPQNIKEMVDSTNEPKKELFNNQFAFGAKKEEKQIIPPVNNTKNEKKDEIGACSYFLINHYKFKEIENFSVLKKEEILIDPKDKKNAEKAKPQAINQTTSKNDKGKGPVQTIPTEPLYEVKIVLDGSNDKTPVSKFPNNYPFFYFSQKKLIIDEKSNNCFISYLVTNGFYYSFYGSKNIKYVCLYSLINEKMKNSFKIYKSKGVIASNTIDSLSTSIAKNEKELINFLKIKIESINTNINSNPLNTVVSNISEKIKSLDEFSFDLLYPLTCIALQKSNQTANYLAVGLKDGSIQVLDTDLQLDKHLFQTLKFEVSQISIDESYLVGCSIDGQVHIYDLLSGHVTYQCYHNPYQNFPILSVNHI